LENQKRLDQEALASTISPIIHFLTFLGGPTKKVGIHTIENTFYDPLQIGKQALEFTNEFRKKNGLPALTWHQSLCDIGVTHSKGNFSAKL
jgi:uncharacterized protein YkwD